MSSRPDISVITVIVIGVVAGYFLVSFIFFREPKLVNAESPMDRARVLLRVGETVTTDELKAHYHQELAKYHPDKTQHLGEEFQELGRKKTMEIIEAYQLLNRHVR